MSKYPRLEISPDSYFPNFLPCLPGSMQALTLHCLFKMTSMVILFICVISRSVFRSPALKVFSRPSGTTSSLLLAMTTKSFGAPARLRPFLRTKTYSMIPIKIRALGWDQELRWSWQRVWEPHGLTCQGLNIQWGWNLGDYLYKSRCVLALIIVR